MERHQRAHSLRRHLERFRAQHFLREQSATEHFPTYRRQWGLDFIEDSRSFALADFDHDGRVEVFLKNRNGPQLRLLRNAMPELGRPSRFAYPARKAIATRSEPRSRSQPERAARRSSCKPDPGFWPSTARNYFSVWEVQKLSVAASIRWPSGLVQDLRGLPLNHRIWVEEGTSPSRMEAFKPPAPRPSLSDTAPVSVPEAKALPVSVETWLLAPVAAPDFSLSDQAAERRHSPLGEESRCFSIFGLRRRPILKPNSRSSIGHASAGRTRDSNCSRQR